VPPILPMVAAAEKAGADWRLVYGGRTRASMAFLPELEQYGDKVTLVPQDELGHPDLPGLLGQPLPETLVYVCGPDPLLNAVETNMAAWADALHLERFAPKEQEFDEDHEFEVEFVDSGITATVPVGVSILSVAEGAGLNVFSSCQEGTCGTCETPIVAGRAEHRDSLLTPTERDAQTTMMICVSRAERGCPKLSLQL
jgi:Flavodoxin reductases (ferredoxin-NADPH reductases) family 1